MVTSQAPLSSSSYLLWCVRSNHLDDEQPQKAGAQCATTWLLRKPESSQHPETRLPNLFRWRLTDGRTLHRVRYPRGGYPWQARDLWECPREDCI